MLSNVVCPKCKHGEDSDVHDVETLETYSDAGFEGYEYTCPECGNMWMEI